MVKSIDIEEVIEEALEKNLPFYAYRKPAQEVEFGLQLSPYAEYKKGEKGFLVSPFSPTQQTPQLFIRQEYSLQNFPHNITKRQVEYPQPNIEIDKTTYNSSATKLIEEMKQGNYQKAVLSRTIGYKAKARERAAQWFSSLCNSYPNAYVYIFSLPKTGTWMGATPELLLEYDGATVTTMALAATRRRGEQRNFTSKEEQEQKIVADYISQRFHEAEITPNLSPLFVKEAGPVEHLCNIISAKDVSNEKSTTLIKLLHPTPAVAGTPLNRALEAISEVEKRPRKYYSGYLGGIKENNTFSLFVNLRCMEIFPDYVQLYVGGGLTSQSQVELEWNETEHKAQTLLKTIKE